MSDTGRTDVGESPPRRKGLRRLFNRRSRLFGRLTDVLGLASGLLASGAIRHMPTVEYIRWILLAVGSQVAGFTLGELTRRLLPNTRPTRMMLRISARRLIDLAVLLAGRKRRLALREEWHAHLAGESGHDPVTWQKVKEALGFVASAIRCRCSDAADAAWTPVDAVLKSRTLSNLFVLVPTWAAAYLVLRHGGTLGVVKAAEGISAIGGMLYGLVRVGRWWRNVKPQEPKAQRAKE